MHDMVSHSTRSVFIALCVFSLAFIGCAKVPEKLVSPTLKIEPVIKDGKELFRLMVSTGIQNENSSTAFLNMKGTICFKDEGSCVLSVPFQLPVILPFDTGIIEVDKTYPENEIMPLIILLGSDKEKLINEKVLERSYIEEKNIGLTISGYEKKNILDLLKEKVNEKNR